MFQRAVMRNSMLAHNLIRRNGHAQLVARVAVDGSVNSAGFRFRLAPYQCVVEAARGLVEKLYAQIGLCFRRLGYHQQAAGVFVDAVHQTETRVVDVVTVRVAEIISQGIHQRPRPVAMTRMHHQTRRFVDHQHHIIFINHIEGYVLGQNLEVVTRPVHDDADFVGRFYLIA